MTKLLKLFYIIFETKATCNSRLKQETKKKIAVLNATKVICKIKYRSKASLQDKNISWEKNNKHLK